MTDAQLPMDAPPVTWRGRLQRRLRRQRDHAARHAMVGAVVSALAVMALHSGLEVGGGAPALADGDTASDAASDAASPVAGPEDARFRAAMVGDLMFARHVEQVAERRGYDSLLEHVTPYLDADYVSGNLEQVVSADDDLPEADKLIHLVSDERALQAMVDAGFTTVSLANNHSMDHGIPGLRDTIEALERFGIEHAGAGETLEDAVEINYQEHGDLTVATLSFTDVFVEGFIARAFQGGALQAEPEVFVPMIQRASANADLVLAHFHWGEEYDIGPSSRQRELAEYAAAAGADVIVGHHPHVLMPVERIGDTIVFYSLGNFVFDQGWSRTRESAIARYELDDDGRARVELVPVYIREATPQPLSGPLAAYRQQRIFQRLRGDGLDWQREGGSLVTYVDHGHVVAGAADD